MKKSTKGIEALIILLGVLIVVFTYFFGVTRINDATTALENENKTLKAQLTAYEYLYTNVSDYQTKTAEMKAENEAIKEAFRYNLSIPDRIMYATNVEDTNHGKLTLSYLNIGDATADPFEASSEQNPILVAGGLENPVVAEDGIMLYSYPMDFGFEVNYNGFKEMVNYLNTVGGAKAIDSVSLAFNSATGMLLGTISANHFVLTGTGETSPDFTVPYVKTGLENIFGTITVAPVVEPEEIETVPAAE